jgi:hypothetical protein
MRLRSVTLLEQCMVWKLRREHLTSQHIEVALVYQQMLGVEEAARYLEQAGIPPEVADRVLLTGSKRPPRMAPAPDQPAQMPAAGCRRKNRIHDAIVEAALKIEKKLGKEIALALLKDEQVPDDVAARVIAPEPRQVRTRRHAA